MSKIIESNILETLNAPTYSIAEASRLVGMKRWTVRRYLQGYEYDYAEQKTKQPPVIKSGFREETYVSFLDLIDLIFVREFLRREFGLPTLRRALDEARIWLGAPHFGQSVFFTSGADQIALRLPEDGSMVVLLTGGQAVMPQIVEMFSNKLDFEDATKYGFARRWYPYGIDGSIVVDPEVSYGRPTLIGTSIPTNNIYDLYLGEGQKSEPVSSWFNIPITQVQTAVQFEHSLCA